ncbi:unnamed protein product [Chrysodeixis includens]|uniref:Laminin N-terminal domain-containing protein n=1 Tax=Chrysodeixis includens TaxID=689277 RepID=A0A9N8KUQ7_CHRIL|nr:unnamed protein product [Chrysodeixis includens]
MEGLAHAQYLCVCVRRRRGSRKGRALLDRLTSTTVSEAEFTSGASNGATGGLLPAPLDVAPYSTVTANASCGDAGAEEFCRDTPGNGASSGATGGLLPAPLDVAPYSTVTANASCGDAGAEEYCRDTPGKRGVVCDVCEGLGGSSSRRHPPAHAVDGDQATWWQSPSLAEGDYQHVALVATLPDWKEHQDLVWN